MPWALSIRSILLPLIVLQALFLDRVTGDGSNVASQNLKTPTEANFTLTTFKSQKPILEDVFSLPEHRNDSAVEVIRQVFHLIDTHFVRQERLAADREILQGGFDAVNRQFGTQLTVSKQSKTIIFTGARSFYSSQEIDSLSISRHRMLVQQVLLSVARARGLNARQLCHVFLNGVLRELDPHSAFLSETEYDELRNGTKGHFGGVGIMVDNAETMAIIREVIPNSSADRSGIKAGDVIIKIDGRYALFSSVEFIASEIRRKTENGRVQIDVFRPSTKSFITKEIERMEVPSKTVSLAFPSTRKDVAVLTISGFSQKTTDELIEEMGRAERIARPKLHSLILDLRGNPGGLLDQAVQVADLFLSEGKIVSIVSRIETQTEYATLGKKIDLPLIVLVNSGSASASEILAGALKDHERAILVGERTFGKGTVQSVFDTENGSALKLTMATYLTAHAKNIQGIGIEPHVNVALVEPRKNTLWMTGSSESEREEQLRSAFNGDATPNHPAVEASATVWAAAENELAPFPTLNELDFSYPSATAGNSSRINPKRDPVLRVALNLLGTSPAVLQTEQLKAAVTRAQADESIEFTALTQKSSYYGAFKTFLKANRSSNNEEDRSFSVLDTKCCELTRDLISFTTSHQPPSGLIGLRALGEQEGPIAWMPVSWTEGIQNHRGYTYIPESLSGFLSFRAKERGSRVEILFKETLYSKAFSMGKIDIPIVNYSTGDKLVIRAKPTDPAQLNNRISFEISGIDPSIMHKKQFEIIPFLFGSNRHQRLAERIPVDKNPNGTITAHLTLPTPQSKQLAAKDQQLLLGGILTTTDGEILARWLLLSSNGRRIEDLTSTAKVAVEHIVR